MQHDSKTQIPMRNSLNRLWCYRPSIFLSLTQRFRSAVRQVEWDMVVIDEAHHITGLNHPRSSLGEFIHSLSQQTRGLLLLTATPEQAGLESHFERLQLIDPARFNEFQQFENEQTQLATAWNQAIEQLRTRATLRSTCRHSTLNADPADANPTDVRSVRHRQSALSQHAPRHFWLSESAPSVLPASRA